MATILVYTLEAFTTGENRPYTGNPAAVCILQYDVKLHFYQDEISDETKQNIANTLNAGATAFVSLHPTTPDEDGHIDGELKSTKTIHRFIRWFTPAKEVPLCGHGTMAASKALLELYKNEKNPGDIPVETIIFQGKYRGQLSASISTAPAGDKELITLNFPAGVLEPVDISDDWVEGAAAAILGPAFPQPLTEVEEVRLFREDTRLFIRLKKGPNEDPLEKIKQVDPDFEKMLVTKVGESSLLGAIVTIEGYPLSEGKRPHFYSRNFVPGYGVNEDIATGSSHTLLVPYWSKELGLEGKHLYAHQASRRGGDLYCSLDGENVNISGSVRLVTTGNLLL